MVENIVAKGALDKNVLSPEIKSLMATIWSYFFNANNNELLKLFHKESDQIKTKESDFISYKYSERLFLSHSIFSQSSSSCLSKDKLG